MSSSLNLMSKMKTKPQRVLIACSGGPDSMALLDIYKDFYEVYVAHVNYHKRKSANRDEKIVKDYCEKHYIPFYKSDYEDSKGGNFQDKARVFRYKFFKDLIIKLDLDMVLVAHHQDDLIETYLLQEKRGSIPSFYGLKKINTIEGIKVYRPLLKYDKNYLINYCENNKLQYGIDESNLKDDYQRNMIRHQIVEKLSKKEKQDIIKEINLKNKYNNLEKKKAKEYLNKRKKININEFNQYDNKEYLLNELLGFNISKKENNELLRQIKQAKSFEYEFTKYYFVKEYDYLEIYEKEVDYYYELNEIKYFKNKYFRLMKKGGNKEGVTIKDKDFPIVVRNYKNGDYIMMLYGKKKINRFFIDNKISSKERKMWPVLINNEGSVILVPKIGCDCHHYSTKHNLYMIKL